MAEREVILKMKDGDIASMKWDIGEDITRRRDCTYRDPDGACGHPSEWSNGESRNHYRADFFCADGIKRDLLYIDGKPFSDYIKEVKGEDRSVF